MDSGADFITNLPAWSGSRFTYPKSNHDVPAALEPSQQSLPSPFTAVVTGASRGIGAATAKALAEAGATGLILTARKAESLQDTKKACEAAAKATNIKIINISADNAAESSAINLAETVKKEFDNKLDLLVNNAGILSANTSAFSKIADMESVNMEVTITTNYLGRFYMIKHLLPSILNNGRATKAIINISSIGSQISGPLGYSISALATNRLSQRVTEAYADEGVFCCALHPGAVLSEEVPAGMPDSIVKSSIDSPRLCGAFILWLLKENRDWLNGRYLDATWDVEELEKKKDEIVAGDKLKMRLVV